MSARTVAPAVAAPVAVLMPQQRPMLQRTCDCGQHTGGGQCEGCKKKKKMPLQRHANGSAAPAIAPPIVHDVLRSPGQPLKEDAQSYFSPRFEHDFSHVRVHTDEQAAESARAVGALAYTVGNHVVFGAGRYSPANSGGRRLLAHELTHVVQQQHDSVSSPQYSLEIGPSQDRYEREAEQVADRIVRVSETGQESEASLSPANLQPALLAPRLQRAEEADPAATPAGPDPAPGPKAAAAAFLLEDDALDLKPGQMKKGEFLDKLQTSVCATADEVLSSVGRTAKGCPFIELWIGRLRTKDSQFIERAIRKYAPDSAGATKAEDYIPFVAARVRRGVTRWANTGEITEVPEDLQAQLGGGGPAAAGQPPSGTGAANGGSAPANANAAPNATPAGSAVLAKEREGGVRDAANPRAIQAQLRSGRPLDANVRSRMETAFGGDFSAVRVHTDSGAASLSTRLNARAFTIGRDVVFGTGEYRPGTLMGDALLAHELAHVRQQGNGASTVASMSRGTSEYNTLEEDADVSAVRATVSIWGGGKGALKDIGKNAMPRLRSGLGLQRCSRSETSGKTEGSEASTASEGGQQARIPLTMPPFECSPKLGTVDEVRIASGGKPTLGVTLRSEPKKTPSITATSKLLGSGCKVTWNNKDECSFALDPFTSVKAGIYDRGIEKRWDPPCKGKEMPVKEIITPELAAKAREGEIEHCNDHKRVYAMTFGRLATLVSELTSSGFSPDAKGDCRAAFEEQFKKRVGFDYRVFQQAFQDLDKLSKEKRDDSDWHTAVYKHDPSPDCKQDNLVYDLNTTLKEVGKHPSEEIIKEYGG